MRRQHIRSTLSMEYVRSLVKPLLEKIDREQMLEYYHQNPKDFEKPDRVTWLHIFVDRYVYSSAEEARQKAEQLHAQAQAASQDGFIKLAEDPLLNQSPSRNRRGDGEGNERGQIRPPEVEELLFRLKPGQVGPLVEAPNGFHIVRVVERQLGGKVSFENACPEIKKKLQNKIGQAEYKKLLDNLRARAIIENSLAQ
jgi:parvulin-like peptidyl-prolyl isomerase